MIERIRLAGGTGHNPYENLALEAALLEAVGEGECILYLWQNAKTVVIGRNQNAWKECRAAELEADGGRLARRLSGGGAVYHDLGNLNFTFLVKKKDYDLGRQLEVILRAARLLGIEAEKTGRNDVTAGGRKFSGNAFYTHGENAYHHGTILVDVDGEALSKYLTVSRKKLESKGVDSVRSRIVNLSELNPGVTVEEVRAAMKTAFGGVYGLLPEPLPAERIDRTRLEALTEQFSAWGWRYGRKLAFTASASGRFSWGEAEIQFEIGEGVVRRCEIYSDAMAAEPFSVFAHALEGCPFSSRLLADRLSALSSPGCEEMVRDLCALIEGERY